MGQGGRVRLDLRVHGRRGSHGRRDISQIRVLRVGGMGEGRTGFGDVLYVVSFPGGSILHTFQKSEFFIFANQSARFLLARAGKKIAL